MDYRIKNDLSYKKTLVFLSIFSVAFAASTAVFGELCVPLSAALLAALYLYDVKTKKALSMAISGAVILINLAFTLLFRGYMLVLGVECVLLALLICVMYKMKATKAGCALFATLLVSVLTVVSFVSIPIIMSGEFSVDAVKTFYLELYETFKAAFIESFNTFAATLPEEYGFSQLSPESIAQAFDSALYVLVAFVVVFAFAICGVTLKLFCAIVSRCDSDPTYVREWKFVTPSLYAYFYMILTLLNIFTGAMDGVLPIAISILYIIFLSVYAYVGWNFIYRHLSQRRRKVLVVIIMLAALMFLSSFALQLLAIMGAFNTVYHNKVNNLRN